MKKLIIRALVACVVLAAANTASADDYDRCRSNPSTCGGVGEQPSPDVVNGGGTHINNGGR